MTKIALGLMVLLTPLFTFTSQVSAVDHSLISVRIEEPQSPTRINEWKLSFAVLDRSNSTPYVKCYVKKPGSGSFVAFGNVHNSAKASGDNGNCQVNSSVMSDQGSYEFKAVVNDSVESGHVFVNYDTSGPSTPGNYSKEHPSICRWVIKFHTAADNGATSKVKIYSSDQKNFDTHEGTRVGTVEIGSDQDGSYTHDRGDSCDKEWYYVIRAFDSVGNQSDYVGDQFVTITTSSTSSTTTPALVVTEVNGSGLGRVSTQAEAGAGEVLGETGDSNPEMIDLNQDENSRTGLTQSLTSNKWFWWILAILLAFVALYGIIHKQKNH